MEIYFGLTHGRTLTNVPVSDKQCWYFDVWTSDKALAYGIVFESSRLFAGYQVASSTGGSDIVKLRLTPVRPGRADQQCWTLRITRKRWSVVLNLSDQNFADLIEGKKVTTFTKSMAA